MLIIACSLSDILYFAGMRSNLFISFLFLLFFGACASDKKNTTGAESDVEAARSFIRYALDGDYNEAGKFILRDSLNLQYLDAFSSNYRNRMTAADKRGYHGASINIHGMRQVNDSVTIVNYSNSFKQKPDSLKVVRQQNQWLVDLKYSFDKEDTLQ